jgi:hypothetical protein
VLESSIKVTSISFVFYDWINKESS